MYRKDGEIPELKQSKYPKKILVFDTEAIRSLPINGVETQVFRMAVSRFISLNDDLSIEQDEYQYYSDPVSIVGAIETYIRKDKAIYIYAHNIKYDLQLSGILKDLLESGYTVKSFVFEDPPTFIKLNKVRNTIIFVDTFNYWQTSLSKMGDQLGIPKLPMPKDTATNEEWYTYCKRDVYVLSEYLLSFIRYLKDNDLCGLGLTLASQAFRTFRHRFMLSNIILHNRKEALEVERASYSGGRVEAFYYGQLPKQQYFKLDVNSMYPYVMREKQYPYQFIAYSENVTLDKFKSLLNRYYCVAQVKVKASLPVYPYKRLHKLIFPTGVFITTLNNPELIYALSRDEILEVQKICLYSQTDIFKGYIDFFYDLKLSSEIKGDQISRHLAKIMMNSLYGKFGQRNVISKVVSNTTDIKYGRITGYSEKLNSSVEVNCLGKDMEVSYKQGESTYSFPAIAGAVTAYARMYLWHLMTQAGLKHVFYCDTDSLMVDKEGYDNLSSFIDTYKLGYLKLEDTTDKIIIYGAKDYIFGEEIKHKGIPKSAVENKPGVWEYEQFRGAKTWLSDGLSPNVLVYTKEKRRKSVYDKGVINPDNTISPIVLAENESITI